MHWFTAWISITYIYTDIEWHTGPLGVDKLTCLSISERTLQIIFVWLGKDHRNLKDMIWWRILRTRPWCMFYSFVSCPRLIFNVGMQLYYLKRFKFGQIKKCSWLNVDVALDPSSFLIIVYKWNLMVTVKVVRIEKCQNIYTTNKETEMEA